MGRTPYGQLEWILRYAVQNPHQNGVNTVPTAGGVISVCSWLSFYLGIDLGQRKCLTSEGSLCPMAHQWRGNTKSQLSSFNQGNSEGSFRSRYPHRLPENFSTNASLLNFSICSVLLYLHKCSSIDDFPVNVLHTNYQCLGIFFLWDVTCSNTNVIGA